MNDKEDEKWVSECVKGNSQAFEFLLEKYQKRIFNVIHKMLFDFEDAKDVTQVVFIKAYEKLDTFNSKYKFFSWIYRITINETLNFINHKKRKVQLKTNVVSSGENPEEYLENTQLVDGLHLAIMELPIEYRIVLILRHFEELSYKEIALMLNILEKTVKSRLFSARQSLKEILLKKGVA